MRLDELLMKGKMGQRGQAAPLWAIGLAAVMLITIGVAGFFAAIQAGIAYLIGSALRLVWGIVRGKKGAGVGKGLGTGILK